jgi:putative transposase
MIVLPDDADLRAEVAAFQCVQQALSAPWYHDGEPLSALALHHARYRHVLGPLSSQMTCSALRLTAGAYASARSNGKPAQRPCACRRARALLLVGKRGRDADLRADGTLSIWTGAGRKRSTSAVPAACAAPLAGAQASDSLTVIARGGRLLGRITLTRHAPAPQGVLPVGVDLNETNALVAVTPEGDTRFVSGGAAKVANKRHCKTRTRVQRTRVQHTPATRKAEHRDSTGGSAACANGLAASGATAHAPLPRRRQSNASRGRPPTPCSCSRRCTSRNPRGARARARARARPRAGAGRRGSAD